MINKGRQILNNLKEIVVEKVHICCHLEQCETQPQHQVVVSIEIIISVRRTELITEFFHFPVWDLLFLVLWTPYRRNQPILVSFDQLCKTLHLQCNCIVLNLGTLQCFEANLLQHPVSVEPLWLLGLL